MPNYMSVSHIKLVSSPNYSFLYAKSEPIEISNISL